MKWERDEKGVWRSDRAAVWKTARGWRWVCYSQDGRAWDSGAETRCSLAKAKAEEARGAQ